MKYNSESHNTIAYTIIMIILSPFYFFIIDLNQANSTKSPFFFILCTAIILGTEYAYIFLRQSMRLYEEILFKTLIERINIMILFLILISLSVTEIYYFETGNITPFFVYLIIYFLWYSVFQKQSVVIGRKNIIVGRKFIEHSLVKSVSFENNNLFIETSEGTFRIHRWFIGKQMHTLKLAIKEITYKNNL